MRGKSIQREEELEQLCSLTVKDISEGVDHTGEGTSRTTALA